MERWLKLRDMRLGVKISHRQRRQPVSRLAIRPRSKSVGFREYRQRKSSARSLSIKDSLFHSLVSKRMKYHPTRGRRADLHQQRNHFTRKCLTHCECDLQDESPKHPLSRSCVFHLLEAKPRRRRCVGIRKLCYRNRYPRKIRRRTRNIRAVRRRR
uniref:Uncharacterized protein n=1 Tax=Cuerna arida TaxID=1464854 RepID=A0A1B6GY46_9HEMI